MIAHILNKSALALAGAALIAGAAGVATAGQSTAHAAAPTAKPQTVVAVAHRAKFGAILVNGKGFALYYWSREMHGKVACTGSCATIWPPVLLAKGVNAPMHVAGVMGTFGVAMRPDGSHQLTFDRHPLYTFQGDKTPTTILCDGVQGWHVYRVGH